ncbi:MAG: hypothetical protein ABIL09_10355 [Gemmatimonadota bacterium]
MDREALVQALLDLENDRIEPVPDPDIAYELAHQMKPQIDELVALRAVESLGADAGLGAAPEDEEIEDAEATGAAAQAERRRGRGRKVRKGAPDGPAPDLLALPPPEQARWIFMERYIPLEKHEEILRYNLDPERFAEYHQGLDQLVRNLLLLPPAVEAAEKNDLPALQKLFASCLLIFRSQCVGDEAGKPVLCSFETLRQHYPSYFYRRRKKPNWFERHDFYTETREAPSWVMCDTEYLNCTLRRPDRKLGGYARDWGLPAECVEHKSLLDDIYDRIICGEALEEDLFSRSCNSITRTTYRARKSHRIAYIVQRVHKITIHGRAGIPHWKATRRLWPGVYPAVTFARA